MAQCLHLRGFVVLSEGADGTDVNQPRDSKRGKDKKDFHYNAPAAHSLVEFPRYKLANLFLLRNPNKEVNIRGLGASDSTIKTTLVRVSRPVLQRYSHVRIEKRSGTDAKQLRLGLYPTQATREGAKRSV